MLRILSSTAGQPVQERIISAYNQTTRVATISDDFDVTPTGTVVYEVLPQYSRLLKHTICQKASLNLLAQEGNDQRIKGIEKSYLTSLRSLRMNIAKKQGRFMHHMDGDTSDNENRGGFYGL